MSWMTKRIIFLLVSYCMAIPSLGQNVWEQAFDNLYSMTRFTNDVLAKVNTMPAKESLDFLSSALDTLKAHQIGGVLPSLLYSTKIEKGIEANDTTNVLISLRTFRDYAYNNVSKDLMESFNYGFGHIMPLDNSWIGESYLSVNLYRQLALMACCTFPETDASQFGIDAIIQTSGLRLFADNAYKFACQALANPKADSLYQHIVRLQQEYEKWEDLTPMNAPTLQYDYKIVDFPERKAIKDSIENFKQSYVSIIYQDKSLFQYLFTSWIGIKNKLRDTEKAIVFAKVERDATENSQYIAFVIDHSCDKPKIINICNESELIAWENDGRLDITGLHDIIWKPLSNEISACSRVYFATDGLLHKLPIENALKDCDCTAIRLSSLRTLSQRLSKNKLNKAVLFGGLRYGTQADESTTENRSRYGVGELPNSKTEVTEIANMLQQTGRTATIYTDNKGTEEIFRSLSGNKIDILHLATHGFFWATEEVEHYNYIGFLTKGDRNTEEDLSMLSSGLLFCGANLSLAGEQISDVEDGVLTARELATLDFSNTNLVVLSACDTGLGEVNSEGVFGLQRGFKLAGAKSLLMSLWKVDDEATRALMTEFYHHLLDGKSKTESLRLAQEYVKSQAGWQSPEYWAGFILLDALD